MTMLLFFILVVCAGEAVAQSDGFNQACGIISSLPCGQLSQIPVCASNGVVYPSECNFVKAQCADSSIRANATCNTNPATTSTPYMNTTTSMTNFTTYLPSNFTLSPNDNSTTNNSSMQPDLPSTTVETMWQNLTTITMPTNWTDDNNNNSSMGNDTTPPMTSMLTLVPTQTTLTAVDDNATTTESTPRPTDGLSALCKIVLASQCPPGDSPICATGDVEYPSLCAFTHAQCYNPNLSILHGGPCFTTTTREPTVEEMICDAVLSKPCNDDGAVLCGSDGITYSNSCAYEKERCVNSDLHVVKPGKC